MSRRSRSSFGSASSLCSSQASTPVSASRSTCASVSDAYLPRTSYAAEGVPALLRPSPSSLLARVGQTQVGNGSVVERPRGSSTEEVPNVVRRALGRYGTVGHDGISKMSSQAFASLCQESGLVDERLASHVNLIFARVTRPGFVMDAAQCVKALELIAKRKACSIDDVHQALGGVDLEPLLPFDLGPCEELLSWSENEREYTLSSIEDALTSGDVILLKGRWLLELSSRRGILPRRQELPEKAIWCPKAAMKMIRNYHDRRSKSGAAVLAVTISCFWLTLEHPDPDGQHLQVLCQRIQQCLSKAGACRRPIEDLAIFWDYASLPQEGTQSEDKIVSREELELGLEKRKMWLSHPKVEVWFLAEDAPGVSTCTKSCSS